MAGEPGADLVLLVRGVVVEDDVDGLVRRHLALDAVEEADELLMAVVRRGILPPDLECAPEGGQDQAAVLTGCRAC